MVELGFLCGREGVEFGGVFDGFKAVVQLDVLSDFGEEDGDFGHQFVIDDAQFGRVDDGVEVRHDAPNPADALGDAGQTLDGVRPVGVCLCFDFGNLRARFGDGGLQGGFDVGGLDGVEAGFFAQMEQYVVVHVGFLCVLCFRRHIGNMPSEAGNGAGWEKLKFFMGGMLWPGIQQAVLYAQKLIHDGLLDFQPL